jgi:transposase
MPQTRRLDVGGDVHQASIAVAAVGQDHGAAGVSLGTIGTRPCDLDTRLRPLHSKAKHLVFGSEAGPCGAWLSRSLPKRGPDCWVVAPSLIPKKAGDRVNPDRRDARQLARLRRSGALTPVDVPPVEDAAIRDVSRAREDSIRALKAAKYRLTAFRWRQAIRYTGQAHGRPALRRGRADVVCPTPAQQSGFQAYVRAVTAHTARLQRLEQERRERVTTWPLAPGVEALQAVRGVQCTVAVTTVAERSDLTRLPTPKQLMNDLGLTPSAYSSRPRRSQGGLTTTGHRPARRARVAGAWASRDPAKVRRPRHRRRAQRPNPLQDLR